MTTYCTQTPDPTRGFGETRTVVSAVLPARFSAQEGFAD